MRHGLSGKYGRSIELLKQPQNIWEIEEIPNEGQPTKTKYFFKTTTLGFGPRLMSCQKRIKLKGSKVPRICWPSTYKTIKAGIKQIALNAEQFHIRSSYLALAIITR